MGRSSKSKSSPSPDKWPLSGTGASLRRDLDGDPLQMSGGEKREALWSTSWWSNFLAKSRSTRKRGWNRSGCVFFSLCPPWNINRPPITIPLWNQYRHPRKTNSLALYSRAESLLFRIHRNPWSLISSSISLFVSSSLLLLREANGRNDDWF